jgi:biopolymer transport protein ExbD
VLRLIDIVLILLFGFISISHIDRSIAVELPQASYLPELPPDFENWAVVAVDESGAWICGFGKLVMQDPAGLENWLLGEKEAGVTHVRLRMEKTRPSAEVAQLKSLCEKLDLALALEVLVNRESVE